MRRGPGPSRAEARDLTSDRLSYRRLTRSTIAVLHRLTTDPHIRRYLLDGEIMTRAWCEQEWRRSERLFRDRGVGLWLVSPARPAAPAAGTAVGFCGFRVFEELGEEPQLLYAFQDSVTGRGYATEVARALLAYAVTVGFTTILSAVDEPNLASIRVLEKVGFRRSGEVPGAFGRILTFTVTRA